MTKNVPWSIQTEQEFRSRVKFTEIEEKVFNLHREEKYTQQDIADILGVSVWIVNSTLKRVKEKYKIALGESDTLPPFFKNKLEIAEWQKRRIANKNDITTTQMSHLIDEWIFDEKSRKILKRRLIDNIKYEQIADEFDMSVRQIKSIVCYTTDKLFKHL